VFEHRYEARTQKLQFGLNFRIELSSFFWQMAILRDSFYFVGILCVSHCSELGKNMFLCSEERCKVENHGYFGCCYLGSTVVH
jgi:hypothetical protein